ncbi:MAG: septum formation family protein [Actinomycetota bacterium]
MRFVARVFTRLALLGTAVLFSATGCGLFSDDDSELTTRDVEAFDLQIGYCFNSPGGDDEETTTTEAGEGSEVERVTVVSCGDAHDFEIFHTFELDDGTYPAPEELENLWIQGCLARFEDFVGSSFDESMLDISAIFPTERSWDELGDREVLCSVTAVDGEPRAGSARGSGA